MENFPVFARKREHSFFSLAGSIACFIRNNLSISLLELSREIEAQLENIVGSTRYRQFAFQTSLLHLRFGISLRPSFAHRLTNTLAQMHEISRVDIVCECVC